jgi:hypothetical protein
MNTESLIAEFSISHMMAVKERRDSSQIPPTLPADALRYALFLCRGHSGTPKAARSCESQPGSRMLVLDEAGVSLNSR